MGYSRPTLTRDISCEYSEDEKESWKPMPIGMSEVTGKLRDGQGNALVFESILPSTEDIDLAALQAMDGSKLRFWPGGSTGIAAGTKTDLPIKPRRIMAIAKMKHPFSVWLRAP